MLLRIRKGSSIHGRSCYLGQCPLGRRYLAKGVGWVHSAGWEPVMEAWALSHGGPPNVSGISPSGSPSWGLRRFAGGDYCPPRNPRHQWRLTKEARGSAPQQYARNAVHVRLLRSLPVAFCDLFYLTEADRDSVWGTGDGRKTWLKTLLSGLGRSSRLLHAAGGHNYSLSTHNTFCDGTRVDFECSYLPDMPHPNPALNTNCEVWRDKERMDCESCPGRSPTNATQRAGFPCHGMVETCL